MKVSQISANSRVSFSSRFKQADINKLIYSAKSAYGWNNPSGLPKLHAMLEYIDKLNYKSIAVEEYNEFLPSWNGGRLNVTRHKIKADGEIIGKSFNPYFALINSIVKDTEAGGNQNKEMMTNQEFLNSWRSHKNTTESEIKKFAAK